MCELDFENEIKIAYTLLLLKVIQSISSSAEKKNNIDNIQMNI